VTFYDLKCGLPRPFRELYFPSKPFLLQLIFDDDIDMSFLAEHLALAQN
jgi:hypothetical protein